MLLQKTISKDFVEYCIANQIPLQLSSVYGTEKLPYHITKRTVIGIDSLDNYKSVIASLLRVKHERKLPNHKMIFIAIFKEDDAGEVADYIESMCLQNRVYMYRYRDEIKLKHFVPYISANRLESSEHFKIHDILELKNK